MSAINDVALPDGVTSLELPEMLDIPSKLYPLITQFNDHRYFLIDGGRNSTKSHTVARLLLYLAEQSKLRIVCGRETQNSIEDSVYALFSDLIDKYTLYFTRTKTTIEHGITGSTIRFIGLREQGINNVKSLEGCDIFWGEESQSLTKASVDILIPTIRKGNAKLFFTLNRFLRHDPIYVAMSGRKDCLHIHINYNDVERRFISDNVITEADECKRHNEQDYRHIWLGEPRSSAEDYLLNFDKVADMSRISPFGESPYAGQRVAWFDYAGAGGDKCVGSLLERKTNVHWELVDQRAWQNPDTDVSIGKTIALNGIWQPNVIGGDADGLGYSMCVNLAKTINGFYLFKGGSTQLLYDRAANQRASAYLILKEFIDQGWLIVRNNPVLVKQMETIKVVYQRNGSVLIMSKKDMKKPANGGADSPDECDSVAMAMFGIHFLLGKTLANSMPGKTIMRVNKSRRR